jgi:hypothetical protein
VTKSTNWRTLFTAALPMIARCTTSRSTTGEPSKGTPALSTSVVWGGDHRRRLGRRRRGGDWG